LSTDGETVTEDLALVMQYSQQRQRNAAHFSAMALAPRRGAAPSLFSMLEGRRT